MHKGLRVIAAVAALGIALALPAAQADLKSVEAQQRELAERIARLQRQTQQDIVEKNRLSRDLRDVERTEARARGDLRQLRSQRAERSEARQKLAAEREARQAERARTEADLAAQLRGAYMMGRNEPLKLLLNQRSPAEFSRNLTYYGYFGRQRAGQIESINQNIVEIEALTAKIDAEDAELARIEGQQKERLTEIESTRQQRNRVLASHEREARNRRASLQTAQRDKQRLDRLMEELSRQAKVTPYDPKAPFAKVRGSLAWPVAGRVAVNFGETPAGGIRSDGVEIDADRGTNVRAIHEGRVIYSDWLPLRGLLIVVDHGNGYLSTYGHCEQLFKAVGARVVAGDVLATVGDSGGRKRPGLYFDIRQGKSPVDPRGWFRTRTPPAG